MSSLRTRIVISVPQIQRPYKIIITNITTETFSPKCRMNASFAFADSSIFNINVEFLKHVRNPFMHTDLHFESTNGKYDLELLNTTVDYCKWLKNVRFKPVVQMILKLFNDHFTNWFKSCPLNKVKRNFLFNRILLTDEKYFAGPVLSEKCGIECREATTNLSRKKWHF